jgi:UDP-N-acetylglucosamine diphosphorylase / glucose-1-phosphate thymidylyltransferase / UDP-N-acetylgalactosamine diphosphorylase / glucosamine-1-phosphate N-acetyltransferase / galactosamine-1-phosphate N-acetyltransferase
MININEFVEGFNEQFGSWKEQFPWLMIANINKIIVRLIENVPSDYKVEKNIAIHIGARIEEGAVIKGPAWISDGCFVGAGAYLRNGVFLDRDVSVGPGCEIKSSIIMTGTSIAHFNFIGDSIIGADVNFEAGAVVANHYNERKNKTILVNYNSKSINTEIQKFGALVGDHCRIGANAVLSPGTLLPKNSIVKRLQLVEQNPE